MTGVTLFREVVHSVASVVMVFIQIFIRRHVCHVGVSVLGVALQQVTAPNVLKVNLVTDVSFLVI